MGDGIAVEIPPQPFAGPHDAKVHSSRAGLSSSTGAAAADTRQVGSVLGRPVYSAQPAPTRPPTGAATHGPA